jgi:putative transposase
LVFTPPLGCQATRLGAKEARCGRARFADEQIVGVLKEAAAGLKVETVCRKHGISEHAFYRWKMKYGGLEVSEARRVKAVEDENSWLKTLVADFTLDDQMLKAPARRC